MKIGMIGQGFIGKSYADDFESRGYNVVRYSNEEPFKNNKEELLTCDITFIAVPTPTTENGFDYTIVKDVLTLVGEGTIAVIKSTLLPGTTKLLQEQFPYVYIFHSPEFLVAKSAAYDAKNPARNIIGYTSHSQEKAEVVLSVLPLATYVKILPSTEAEMIKYMGNIFLTQKVIFANLVHDLCQKVGADYYSVQEAVGEDVRITHSHLAISHGNGRGAGGYCFIKDLAAFSQFYEKTLPENISSIEILRSLEKKNIELLVNSNKDIELLQGVYGKDIARD